ncbi:MAG: SufD family Fe-S cluster assembly protein [Nitrososphaerota archaeon]|nr:SufD family Fe-S cluster assembly protein [Candidatus Bathyarchaeota archaeon]MDW8193560.1 SufD family Fe-S cluster assembly protein [Nitrososphaerota archaeon]
MPSEKRGEMVELAGKDSLKSIPHKILEEAYKAGAASDEERAGTFFHIDTSTVYSRVNELFKGKVELMDIKVALQKYQWLSDYMWSAVPREGDAFTRRVAEDFSGGYFLRILPDAEVTFPLQSCMVITQENLEQRLHNIIIAEENSKAHLITSCLQHSTVTSATHIGVTEIYVKRGAYLNSTMVHQWREESMVRPRSAAIINENGTFVSNYICLRPVRDVQMYPVAYCMGEGSKAIFNSILYGHRNTFMDIGSKAILEGRESRAEMISRAVTREGSKIIVRGSIEGNGQDCKGHLECKGLILDDESFLQSIPELTARSKSIEITHEAAVGRISEKEIVYLMTRKLSREQAVSLIIRGFMDAGIMGLPETLSDEINRIIDIAAKV